MISNAFDLTLKGRSEYYEEECMAPPIALKTIKDAG
jgi:hypothetical protein